MAKRKQGKRKTPKSETPVVAKEDTDDDASSQEPEDYAGQADFFAAKSEEDEGDDNPMEEDSSHSGDDDDEDDDEKEEVDDDDDDDGEEEEEDVTAVFKGVAMPDDDEDESDDPDSQNNVGGIDSTKVGGAEICTFDMHNLVAVNSHQISSNSLYDGSSSKKKPPVSQDSGVTIPLSNTLNINEEFLLAKATEGCAQLVQALWMLPTEKSDAGPLASLPLYDEIRIPRALPPPPPKKETKWEKFAKEKGLPLNKEKRSRKVFDEATGEWMYRHGYQKANSSKESEWPIMEVKATDDPYADPWEKIREAKRARKDKNTESRMRNEERAGALPKGTTNRVLKGLEKSHKAGKSGGDMDRDQPSTPVGIPVDLRNSNNNKSASPATGAGDRPQLRGKASTLAALAATQRSTASLGKFDRMREGEPERRKVLSKLKKRKLEAPTDKRVIATEGERSMKILKTVVNGGGAAQENARRKGALAKGETAYDYDYDDGGNSGFQKKKGRAGSGKLRKMTKKRVK